MEQNERRGVENQVAKESCKHYGNKGENGVERG